MDHFWNIIAEYLGKFLEKWTEKTKIGFLFNVLLGVLLVFIILTAIYNNL